MKKIEWEKIDDEEDVPPMTEDEREENNNQMLIFPMMNQQRIGGPLIDWLYPRLNKYELHTNFKITKNILQRIKNTDGIEAITVLSPYRLLVAIGKLFEDETVQVAVKRSISNRTPNERKNQQ